MNFDAILFDFDGTLVNTNKLIQASYKHTFITHYNKQITNEEIMNFWGLTLKDVFNKIDPLLATSLEETYRAFNLKNHDELISLFPKVLETLSSLHKHGIPLGIVTNKIRKTTEKGIRYFQMQDFFQTLISSSDIDKVKPHPDPIFKAMENLKVSSSKILMVGDSPHDIICAKNAGIFSVAVGWSLYDKETLLSYEPDYFISSLDELFKIVKIA